MIRSSTLRTTGMSGVHASGRKGKRAHDGEKYWDANLTLHEQKGWDNEGRYKSFSNAMSRPTEYIISQSCSQSY